MYLFSAAWSHALCVCVCVCVCDLQWHSSSAVILVSVCSCFHAWRIRFQHSLFYSAGLMHFTLFSRFSLACVCVCVCVCESSQIYFYCTFNNTDWFKAASQRRQENLSVQIKEKESVQIHSYFTDIKHKLNSCLKPFAHVLHHNNKTLL